MTHFSSLAMQRYFIEPRTTKCVKGYWFLSFARKYRIQLLDSRLDFLKTAYKKVVHRAGEYFGNKIAATVTKSNDDEIVKPEMWKKYLFHQKK